MNSLYAKQLRSYTSLSANMTLLQREYNDMFFGLCDEYEVEHPFQLEDQRTQEFFADLSTRWKKRKLDLYKAGKIAVEKV